MIAIRRAAFAAPFVFLSSAAVAVPSAEIFGNLPAMSHVHLSPDGTHFSAIEPVGGASAVLVFQLHPAPGTKPQVFALTESSAVDSKWITNDRLIGMYYQNKYQSESSGMNVREYARGVSMSLSGKKAFPLMTGTDMYVSTGSTTRILATSAENPNLVYMEAFKGYAYGDQDTRLSQGKWRLNLFSVDVDTNSVGSVENGTDRTREWVVDHHGNPVARMDRTDETQDPKNRDVFYVKDGKDWREAASYDNYSGTVASLDGILPDGAALAVDRYGDKGRLMLETLPVSASGKVETLFNDPLYDLDDVLHDEWTGAVIGVTYVADKREYRYFDPQLDRIQKGIEKALPGQSVEISSWDAKRSMFLITAEDPKNPPGIYLYTPATGKLDYLMGAYPDLQPADLGEVKTFDYKSRDGLDIHGYLTLAPGKTGKNLPMVVFPHGGPDSRDELGFDWMAQFFASRGYAVLQTNFRGSTGYGVAFRNAGFGEWGRKMQDDITDGVKKAIADGIADPKRICIVGASYGGYAALAGATFTPELYACAVSYAGIADVSQILGQAKQEAGEHSVRLHFWEDRIGSRTDVKTLQEISPAYHAADVRAPVLLLHSTLDMTVPYAQSRREQAALQALGKPVEYVQIAGDDHYLSHAGARIQVLKAMETFLKAHIGN
ncbi:MAG TPA: S9 family peptidase [Rhizomicrobium sp.]|nr:S9 family peptidase [Rhizomicrobium sp.]